MNLDSYYVHYKHPVNRMLRDYNDFCKTAFKTLSKKEVGVAKE